MGRIGFDLVRDWVGAVLYLEAPQMVEGGTRWSRDVTGWSKEVDKDRRVFKDFMREVRKDIKNILSILGSKNPVSGSASPLKLTEFGESISAKINGKEWAERLSQSEGLRSSLEGKSNYDIQEGCIQYAQLDLPTTDQELQILNQCAYDLGIEVAVVRRVLGIELRDALTEIIRENPTQRY